MLKKYFKIETTPEDSDESNTIYIVNYMAVVRTFTYIFSRARISYDILDPEFLREMDEYAGAVIGDRHMLPVVRQRMEQYHYDGIFLATEDEEALNTLRETFHGKVFTVAQERHI